MSLTAEAFARLQKLLLPPSRIWDLVGDLHKIFLAAGDEMVRIEGRILDLIRESDPRQAVELLPEYERDLALVSTGTTAERQARVVAKMTQKQRVRPADFQQVLAPLFGQLAADVVIIERGRAFAVLVGDDREIYRFFAYRNPALPGTYDIAGAQSQIDQMAHSHTKGYAIESIDFLCDEPFSLCDRDILGV